MTTDFDRLFATCTTEAEIKRVFRQQAMIYHPDHGGQTADFQALNAAQSRALKRLELGAGSGRRSSPDDWFQQAQQEDFLRYAREAIRRMAEDMMRDQRTPPPPRTYTSTGTGYYTWTDMAGNAHSSAEQSKPEPPPVKKGDPRRADRPISDGWKRRDYLAWWAEIDSPIARVRYMDTDGLHELLSKIRFCNGATIEYKSGGDELRVMDGRYWEYKERLADIGFTFNWEGRYWSAKIADALGHHETVIRLEYEQWSNMIAFPFKVTPAINRILMESALFEGCKLEYTLHWVRLHHGDAALSLHAFTVLYDDGWRARESGYWEKSL